MEKGIAVFVAALSVMAVMPMHIYSTNLYYPSPTVSCNGDMEGAESDCDEGSECDCEIVYFPSQQPDRLAEEQHNEVGWAARRDELSDDLSR